ncbi:unnamed protein product [Blepharisma stoltei]|uniref:Uncharacterized protein n=1 Tax=Blepharisma stoltei TaxID=1481888 RepID=A0AAU9JPA3_9CILI|nr:unnamed protein product [Blepharisma stoltei]
MLDHFSKAEAYYVKFSWVRKCYYYKIFHLAVQLLYLLVIGATAIANPGDCSSPIQVFLEGLFGLYISGVIINSVVGGTRLCKAYMGNGMHRLRFEGVTLGIDTCYYPVYFAFTLFEVAWYLLGSVWYFQDNDCNSEYSVGAGITVTILILWYIFIICLITSCVWFNWYIHHVDMPRIQNPKENEVKFEYPNVDKRPYPEPSPMKSVYKNTEDRTYPQTPAKNIEEERQRYERDPDESYRDDKDVYGDVQGGVKLYVKKPGVIFEEDPRVSQGSNNQRQKEIYEEDPGQQAYNQRRLPRANFRENPSRVEEQNNQRELEMRKFPPNYN